MAGIVSYGGYVPFYRINRSEIARFWGLGSQPGEKAVAGYDEDSLTMAVAAARDCLKEIDVQKIDGLYFASTTAPYQEKQSAALIAAVLGLKNTAITMDFGGSLRCATNALKAAFDAVNSGSAGMILVCAADVRLGYPSGAFEMSFGDGAAAVLVGSQGLIATLEYSQSYFDEIQDVWRTHKDTFVRQGEDRFILEEGYTRVMGASVSSFLKKYSLTAQDITRVAMPAQSPKYLAAAVKKLKFEATQVLDNLSSGVGDTGAAMPLMYLVSALEISKENDRILLTGYGNGCDVFSFKGTAELKNTHLSRGIQKHIDSKEILNSYSRYLRWRELIPTQPPARPPIEERQPSPVAQWRENQKELRLQGTKCVNCGTPQYPPQRVCINCGTKDKYELYGFYNKPAKLFSFCHDYVMQSTDPPVTVSIVDFEGGGRLMCDMTDRNLDRVKVGMPVEMTFRKLYYVGGIYNYWWKCQPVRF